MAGTFTGIFDRPSQVAEAAKRFMSLPEETRSSLAQRTPAACFNDITDCIAAVCGDSISRTHASKHRPPFYDAVRPHVRAFGERWDTMKGPMTYFMVNQLKDLFCQEPPTAAMAVVATQPAVVTKPVAATNCAKAAVARESAWVILGELLVGGLLVYLFRGQIPQFSAPSGAMGASPYRSAISHTNPI